MTAYVEDNKDDGADITKMFHDFPTPSPKVHYAIHRMILISRNAVLLYWKFTNLIGSPVVFYSLMEHNRSRVTLWRDDQRLLLP